MEAPDNSRTEIGPLRSLGTDPQVRADVGHRQTVSSARPIQRDLLDFPCDILLVSLAWTGVSKSAPFEAELAKEFVTGREALGIESLIKRLADEFVTGREALGIESPINGLADEFVASREVLGIESPIKEFADEFVASREALRIESPIKELADEFVPCREALEIESPIAWSVTELVPRFRGKTLNFLLPPPAGGPVHRMFGDELGLLPGRILS